MQELTKEYIEKVNRERKINPFIGCYGIKYLDDCLIGIHKEDFVLIGAETGHGKTELAIELAFKNAEKGMKVHYFGLESDEDETMKRKLYKLIASAYYGDYEAARQDFNYRKYVAGELETEKYELSAMGKLAGFAGNLFIHSREKGVFNVNTLTQIIGDIKDQCGLIVLDHLDYFDLDTNENENRQMTEIMKTLRNINATQRIPLVVISHLRKKERGQMFPTIDDFMGSSNKPKIAKTVILLAREYEGFNQTDKLFPTLCQVVKSRLGGSSYLGARLYFDITLNGYLDNYALVKIKNGGNKIEELEKEYYPSWATKFEVGVF